MEQKKNCGNCKHYLAHYVKTNTSFMPMYTGHCINEEIPWKVRKINVTDVNCCEKWESNEELKKERKENIKNIIKNMRSKLIQIEKILADDL